MSEFKPYVPPEEAPRELSLRAAVIGSLLGILFGASSVYLALKVGLTVSASIPIAVLSIPIFAALGRGSILENNITQTVGSAGESIAAGAVFTVPALLVMGYDLELSRTTLIALTGGWLGVLLMIPLRRSLIVKEHGKLPYPEGTACAEVLEAGERGGVQARLVFVGLLLGMVYKLLYKTFGFWREIPEKVFARWKGSVAIEASPELLGVGYIIGPRIAGTMVAGGVLSYLVLIPMVAFFADKFGGEALRAEFAALRPSDIRSRYIFYIGVGAVAAGGFISLARALPTIVSTFAAAMRGLGKSGVAGKDARAAVPRTERDMPFSLTLGGAALIAVFIAVVPWLGVNPLAAVLVVVFGFFFCTVSARICGQIGSSSNPISGMTIATLLLTSLIFVGVGWSGSSYRAVALTVGAIVCVAAANAGATSQDLKTGYLLGATPKAQQYGLIIGVTTSALLVGWTLYFLNAAYTTIEPIAHPKVDAPPGELAVPGGRVVVGPDARIAEWIVSPVPADAEVVRAPDGKDYRQVRFSGDRKRQVPGGKLLVDEAGLAHYAISPGIVVGGAQAFEPPKSGKFEAPKAQLMALIIDGILERSLEWALVLFGVFIAICLELAGVEALPFAVGLYLPISSSAPIFAGGVARWIVGKTSGGAKEGDAGRGVLFSSGLIAGGSLCGLVAAGLATSFGEEGLHLVPSLSRNGWLSLAMFVLLGGYLVRVARKK